MPRLIRCDLGLLQHLILTIVKHAIAMPQSAHEYTEGKFSTKLAVEGVYHKATRLLHPCLRRVNTEYDPNSKHLAKFHLERSLQLP